MLPGFLRLQALDCSSRHLADKPLITRKHYSGPLTDSHRWDAITIRADDIIVVTPPKSGTTWMQTIIALLITGDPDVEPELPIKMPWIDIRVRDIDEVAERLANMPHRRSMKSHTPLDGLPIDDEAQYICVFRHPLDAHFSMRNHVNNIPLAVFDPWYGEGDKTIFQRFLEGSADGEDCDAMPLAHIIQHFKAAKALSHRSNVTLFHYADMKRDLAGVFAQVAKLLDTSHTPKEMEWLRAAASFDHMKSNADRYAPGGGTGFYRSDAAFFESGSTGKWEGKLSSEELQAYDAMMKGHLSQEDRRWVEFGSQA